jgi:hypothetical protein
LRIREIRAVGLRGVSPEGGWSEEIIPAQYIHTLIAVFTDEGVTGYGSVYTNDALVRGALGVLEPLIRDEYALDTGAGFYRFDAVGNQWLPGQWTDVFARDSFAAAAREDKGDDVRSHEV